MSGPADTVLVDVPMPQMGVSVTEGTVAGWLVDLGERVEADQPVCEISTDKLDTEIPAPAAGELAEILVEPGETVQVGVVLARISVDAAVAAELGAVSVEGAPAGADREAPSDTAPAPTAPASEPVPRPADRRRYSPLVRRIAAEHSLDLDRVPGTGRDGRVSKKDVLAYLDSRDGAADSPPAAPGVAGPSSTAAQAAGESVSMSRMRRAIAARMRESLDTAAHSHTWIEIDMDSVERRRRELGITALPLIAHATVATLRAHPELNAWLEGERLTIHRDVQLGIAVSLDDRGLLVPVIRDAQQLSPEGFAARIRDLAGRARENRLLPDELGGGTFTITNQGTFGTLMGAPIINLPEVAILDVQAIEKRPVVVTDDRGVDALGIRPTSIFGLSWDHRAMDGAQAARFLADLKSNLERTGSEK